MEQLHTNKQQQNQQNLKINQNKNNNHGIVKRIHYKIEN